MTKRQKLVITGANGFIGRNFRIFLKNQPVSCISIARKNFKQFKFEHTIISSTYSTSKIVSGIKNYDCLIHLVGIGKQNPSDDYFSTNFNLTKKIIDICKKAKISRIIYLSGLGVSKNSTSSYFISKFLSEELIKKSGLAYTILRPSYIIGQNDLFTKNLKKQIKTGNVIIPGSGRYAIQPIFVNDVSKILFQASYMNRYKNKILDLVGPQKITFEKYVKIFSKNRAKISKINLETAFYNAIHNPQNEYGVDDLNIMLGNFEGNFKKLLKVSNLKFTKFRDVLESSSLS